jgi:hypothetical protein
MGCLKLKHQRLKKCTSSPSHAPRCLSKLAPPNHRSSPDKVAQPPLISEATYERYLCLGEVSDEGSLVAVLMTNCGSLSSGYTLTFHNWFVTYHTESSTFLFDSHKESMSNHIMVCWHSSRSSMEKTSFSNAQKRYRQKTLTKP